VSTRTKHGARRAVLIADDEPRLRQLVRVTIASNQYEVLEAEDGDEAWALIQQHRPALVILDVKMPGRDGLELTRAIKAAPELAGIHVILLTAYGQDPDVQAGQDAGADLFLTKPFSPLQLLTAVERALGLP
jgi:CheY-like chemotaxis protein